MSNENSISPALKKALQLARDGNIQDAKLVLRDVLKADPNNADAWFIATKLETKPEAQRALLQRVLTLNPNHQAAQEALNALNKKEEKAPAKEPTPVVAKVSKTEDKSPAKPEKKIERDSTILWIAGIGAVLLLVSLLGNIYLFLKANNDEPKVEIIYLPEPTNVAAEGLTSSTSTITPTPTEIGTATPSPTMTDTPTETNTPTATPTPTDIPSSTPIPTATPDPAFRVQGNGQVFTLIDARIIDAEYSYSLDRIIAVSDQPYQLMIIAPETMEIQSVSLPRLPTSVSVSPDGYYAAVGHFNLISYIDLQTPSVFSILHMDAEPSEIVLGDRDWVYVIPAYSERGSAYAHAVNITTGEDITSGRIRSGSAYKMHPSGHTMYGTGRGLSRARIERAVFDEDGLIEDLIYLEDPAEYPACGNLWISRDGLRIFTACGNVFRSTEDPSADMTYNGTLDRAPLLLSVSHSLATKKVFGIMSVQISYNDSPTTTIGIWNYVTLTREANLTMPDFTLGDGRSFPIQGTFIFSNNAGTAYYVLANVSEDAGLVNNSGLIIGNICSDGVCTSGE